MLKTLRPANSIIRKTGNILLVLVFFNALCTSASAQFVPNADQQSSSSRIQSKDALKPGETIVQFESEITTSIEIPGAEFVPCQANITLGYHQRNTLARVETTIDYQSCAVGTGEYNLAITVRDDNGDSQKLEFSEVWEQTDNNKLIFTKDYPIGENVGLRRVRTQKTRCTCTELAAE